MNEKTCSSCHAFKRARGICLAATTPRYGRCMVHMMFSLDSFGAIIPDSERPAARFDNDTCDEWRNK